MAQGVRGTGSAKERNFRYLLKHPERRRNTCRTYRELNKEKVKDAARKWAKKDYMLNGRLRANAWETNNPERHRAYKRRLHLKSNYNLSEKDFLSLLHKQENRCAICETQFEKTPFVDHDHKTGAVRGLLCRHCNTALGLFKDNLKFLTSAIEYLCK